MTSYKPIVAIVGNSTSNPEREELARKACSEIGRELARAEGRIAVYSSDKVFIEQDIVTGYVESDTAGNKSITCHYPYDANVHFPEMDTHKEQDYFEEDVDSSSDWEVSFYRSLTQVDGVLLLGGGPSTLIAGQIALSRDLPIVAILPFGGAASRIWREHVRPKVAFLEENDKQIMSRWQSNSPKEIAGSLNGQYKRRLEKLETEGKALSEIKGKADKWDEYERKAKEDRFQTLLAGSFLFVFVLFLIIGLVTTPPGWLYSVLTILGLCFAGGVGATIRMLTPDAPASKKWTPPILGVMVGLVFSLLYLIPQLTQNAGFLIPSNDGITLAVRVQYVCSLIVSLLAGLGFDLAIKQLLKKAEQTGSGIAGQKM